VVTYLADREALGAFLHGARRCVRAGGRLVLDAFVPRRIPADSRSRRDYRRQDATRDLERARRITVLPDGRHRIERHYVEHRAGASFTTVSTIRPYAPQDLVAAAHAHGWQHVASAYDYGSTLRVSDAPFATHVFVAADSAPRQRWRPRRATC
jgi:hypothetical protein